MVDGFEQRRKEALFTFMRPREFALERLRIALTNETLTDHPEIKPKTPEGLAQLTEIVEHGMHEIMDGVGYLAVTDAIKGIPEDKAIDLAELRKTAKRTNAQRVLDSRKQPDADINDGRESGFPSGTGGGSQLR